MHILTNISRGKGNQTMKLSQLRKYETGNTFLKTSFRNVGEKIPEPFTKKSK